MNAKTLRNCAVAVLAVVSLILGFIACQQSPGGDHVAKPTATPTQPAPSPSSGARDIGGGVLAEGVAAVDLTAKVSADQAVPVEGAEGLSQVLEVGPSGQLASKVRLFFPLNRAVVPTAAEPHNGLPFVATRSEGMTEWQYLEATVTPDSMFAVVEVDHLSRFWPFSVRPLLEKFKQLILPSLTESIEPVKAPVCENSAQAKEGFKLQWSGKSDTLLGCLGLNSKGQRYLKVVNTLRIPLDVELKGLAYQSELRSFPDSFTKLMPPGKALLPREEVIFLVQGDSAMMYTEVSGLMQSLYQLDVGLQTLGRILALGKGQAVRQGVAFASSIEHAQQIGELLQLSSCSDAVVAGGWGKILRDCLPLDWLVKEFGAIGVVASAIMIFDGLASFLISQWDFAKAQVTNDGRGTLFVTRTTPKITVDPSLRGAWTAWNVWAEIAADGTGKIAWDCNGRGCEATFKPVSSSGKVLVVEITSSSYSGQTSVSNSQSFKAGDRITFSPSETAGVLNASGPGLGMLCGPDAPVGYCGGG